MANSLVFPLIGLDVNIPQLAAPIGPIGLAVGAVLLCRALVVYGLSAVLNSATAIGHSAPGRCQRSDTAVGVRGETLGVLRRAAQGVSAVRLTGYALGSAAGAQHAQRCQPLAEHRPDQQGAG